MTDVDIPAIKARLEAATPGPWHMTFGGVYLPDGGRIASAATAEDEDFIAHAPADIASLLALVEQREGELKFEREANGKVLLALHGFAAVIEKAKAQHFPMDWHEPSDGTSGTVCGGPCEWTEWPCPPAALLASVPSDTLAETVRAAKEAGWNEGITAGLREANNEIRGIHTGRAVNPYALPATTEGEER